MDSAKKKKKKPNKKKAYSRVDHTLPEGTVIIYIYDK